MYRPEGWKETRAKAFIPENSWIVGDTGIAYEAGADAMLEGLLKGDESSCDVFKTTVTGIAGDVPLTAYGKAYPGQWVFIPEEENEK